MLAANKVDGMIVADGGITCPGDMAKAFCAGAHFVMGGSLFAGHYENPGEIIEEDGKKFKLFYGMSSTHAMTKHYGFKASYRSSEGRVVKMPLKGHINETIEDYLGGLRSCCTYIDASNIE
jgi:GMP reductase